ncbi:hypothetical protein [Pseudomonas guariconensis]|uniref:hypothetical protein n=1 Tax=Pseudomonas guariconensis TaxID=1288410 RepID=UPI002D1E4D44|nr:hypothetical protein [Pseudomonas guariconensis]MEB3843940.1 hypothetical protein [Pseudomonas guariconensis]MEB3876808.1 hypothetical protein [Pseudomonas guariconensis]MEB3881732.1 hypothetical protein [Pseudomonas guariconensis]MEB3898489.1 hypothetical protein [Pseudomonas guariconensis]
MPQNNDAHGWIACDDGLHLIQMDKTLSHYGWVFRKVDGGLPYSVREATPHEMAHAQARQHLRIGVAQITGQAPAPQPNPDPIAWMVGTAIWWTKEEAERDAAETGLPIVGLGAMTGAAPAEQHQGEPVAYAVFTDNGNIRTWSTNCAAVAIKVMREEGKQVVPLYANSAPPATGEVERLRAQVDTLAEWCGNALNKLADRDALLREALPAVEYESGRGDAAGTSYLQLADKIKSLSASAEPSAPKVECCKLCGGEGSTRTGIDEAPTTVCSRCDGTGNEPSAPVERDERAVIKPDAWRVSINGNWEYFRSYEQALKELREWQSDYLPEEFEEAKADGLCEPEPVYARAALERRPS